MLTGLSSPTSFGQPDWDQVFYRIASEHPYSRTNICRTPRNIPSPWMLSKMSAILPFMRCLS